MKQIEEYVNKVYQNVKGNNKEIQELKSEMKNHLLEAVHELKIEGKSEQEAIEIAIERFGKENELRSIISQLFQTQKAFGKKLLYTGLGILIISIIIFGFTIKIGNDHVSDQSIIAYEIADIVSSGEELSNAKKKEIEVLVHEVNYIAKVSAYKENGLDQANNSEPVYEFEREISFPSTLFLTTYSYGTDDSFVKLEVVEYRTFAIITLFVGITSFGLLFIIWLIINAYHKRRKSIGLL
ncbi:permease prefix domain 1-containing protein [Bacillus sp. JJ1533]|uniref:permease prefix domain 1-containing protein n=1 Tax=Bacillus sp. JJ1533 TaxID=3122959 RepID=UPI002FFE0CEE